ncbi:MAG: type II toxin-antitoxin system PemK/MazF family toxin [Sphingopyxis terrae]|uniref:type II toxin-antitoxin system PemK/MazF family toxin n=1 Tax=Sphingopyxis terrae TaxID=33052 RepID=UPI003F81E1E7
MAIKYVPPEKSVVICDFSWGGFKSPEMIKRRPVVVLVGRLPRRDNLVTVVPLSGTASDARNKYHCRIDFDVELPHPFPATAWWAKCDMVASVCLHRLEFFRTARDHTGRRQYLSNLRVSDDNFALIQQTVKHALGLD